MSGTRLRKGLPEKSLERAETNNYGKYFEEHLLHARRKLNAVGQRVRAYVRESTKFTSCLYSNCMEPEICHEFHLEHRTMVRTLNYSVIYRNLLTS